MVPRRERSKFIAEAVREKLRHEHQIRAVDAAAGVWTDEGRADPETEIRAWREGWLDRVPTLYLQR